MSESIKSKKVKKTFVGKDGLPEKQGSYLIVDGQSEEAREIDVYDHPVKGLCCYVSDISCGCGGGNINNQHDDHVSVQRLSIKFIKRIGPCS